MSTAPGGDKQLLVHPLGTDRQLATIGGAHAHRDRWPRRSVGDQAGGSISSAAASGHITRTLSEDSAALDLAQRADGDAGALRHVRQRRDCARAGARGCGGRRARPHRKFPAPLPPHPRRAYRSCHRPSRLRPSSSEPRRRQPARPNLLLNRRPSPSRTSWRARRSASSDPVKMVVFKHRSPDRREAGG